MAFLAVTALFLAAASLLVIGGAVFTLFLFLPLFLLGLLGVLAGLEDRTVNQHNPSMDARRWRNGPWVAACSGTHDKRGSHEEAHLRGGPRERIPQTFR